MTFLIIGLGSMGRRRIRNLRFHKIPKKNIVGVDLRKDRCQAVRQSFGINVYDNYRTARSQVKPDVYIISTPPHQHRKYMLDATREKKHFFVEISTTDTGYTKLLPSLKKSSIIAAPSCTFRFFDPIKKIKDLLDQQQIGKVYGFTHHMGQYLPDWHPYEDYRQFYVAKRISSAMREMTMYETQWLQWLFSSTFIDVYAIGQKCSPLHIKDHDMRMILLKSKSNLLGTITIDLLARSPIRSLRIIGQDGLINWEWTSKKLRIFRHQTGQWKNLLLKSEKKIHGYVTNETMYEREIKAFLDAVSGKKQYPYTFEEDFKNLQLLTMIEQSIRQKKRIRRRI